MSSDPPLPQAYKKATEADSHAEARPPRLAEAIKAHEEAAILFGQAEEQTEDDGAGRTLRTMKQQHSKMAVELTRKLTTALAASPARPSTSRSATTPNPPTAKSRSSRPSALSSPAGPPPPFALSPASPTSLSASSTSSRTTPLAKQASERARLQRQMEFSSSGPGAMGRDAADSLSSHSPNAPSSLYASSSSSSDRTIDGSFMMLRHEKSDPFQRFWDVVEGMLQDHSSNPVAFASAPLGSVIDSRSGRAGSTPSSHRKPRSSSSSHKTASPSKTPKDPSAARQHSNLGMISSSSSSTNGGQDSFYIVPPSRQASTSSSASSSSSTPPSSTAPNPKTLEELTLENASLRSSLDTLALHAQELERRLNSSQAPPMPSSTADQSTPKAAKAPPLPPHPPPGASIMLGGSVVDLKRLKKEAEKVWREEERVRRVAEGGGASTAGGLADSQRITALEAEVAHVKAQNEKQRDTIQRYKLQFEKIKSGARQRREAKAGVVAASGSGETVATEPASGAS